MPRTCFTLLLCLAFFTGASLTGCVTNADREINRAKRALDAALDISADALASEDYNDAEELLDEAIKLSEENRIGEAKTTAIQAKLRAEDATRKAKERHQIEEFEMETKYGG